LRRPDEIGLLLSQHRKIGCEGAGIGGKILSRRELRGVDENRHHDPVGAAAGTPHQRQMPRVQGAHGRHQRNRRTGVTPARHAAAQCRDSSCHLDPPGHAPIL
jgi:hypothetical protein